jgi:hypothetical protein
MNHQSELKYVVKSSILKSSIVKSSIVKSSIVKSTGVDWPLTRPLAGFC